MVPLYGRLRKREIPTMLKILLYSTIAAAAGCTALLLAGCIETAPAGDAMNANGEEKDPTEMLSVGSQAPEFDVQDDSGERVRLADLRGQKNVVLIFYPGNDTPGCTKQLCEARDEWAAYQELDVQVYGVNPADAESHTTFRDKYAFPFPLLADTEGSLIRNYGARGMMGITKRTVYGIDKDGIIVFAERGMPNTATILAAFKKGGA